jgi:rhodanese-related sulfurtransferase
MITVLVMGLAALVAASQLYPWVSARWVSPERLQAWLEEGHVVVADLRSPAAYAAGHIPGAQSVPWVRVRQMSRVWSPGSRLVLVDWSGYRSLHAALFLRRRGFRDVWCLSGGILGWARYRRRVVYEGATTAAPPLP